MIPQLGFNHEDSGQRFVLDLADLHRDKQTIPAAFRAVKAARADPSLGIAGVGLPQTMGIVTSSK